MMDKQPRKELTDGIRDSLKGFQESYDRTEWEHFQQQRKSKRRKPIPLFVKLAGIAASLFLMVYASVRLLPIFEMGDGAGKPTPKEVSHPQKDKVPETLDSLNVDSVMQVVVPNPSETTGVAKAQTGFMSPMDLMPKADADIPTETGSRKVAIFIESVGSLADSVAIDRPLNKTDSLQAVSLFGTLSGHNRKPAHTKPDRSTQINFPKPGSLADTRVGFNHINIGFNVTPSVTNKGLSLGGGVSAQLPLSNHFTAEVGVSYMNLKVGTDIEADRTDTVNQQTVGIRNAVGMVSVPISLNYAISGNFSASLGLMPFRVVRDQRTDILQRYRWVNNGDATGRLEGERTRTKRADSLYMGNTYLGFIQVSGRYSPPFLKKRNVVLSPFVAIPVGRLRNEEYRWLHGGVSIRVYLR